MDGIICRCGTIPNSSAAVLKKKKNNPCPPPLFPFLLPPFAQRRARAKTDTLLKHQRASMSGPVRYGRVVGPYDAEGDPSGLAVGPGEVVEVMREVMDRAGMLFVVLDGEAGFVPEACVEILPEDFAPDDDGDGGDGKKKKKKKKSKWSFTLFKKKKVPLRGLGFLCCWWCVCGFCFVFWISALVLLCLRPWFIEIARVCAYPPCLTPAMRRTKRRLWWRAGAYRPPFRRQICSRAQAPRRHRRCRSRRSQAAGRRCLQTRSWKPCLRRIFPTRALQATPGT